MESVVPTANVLPQTTPSSATSVAKATQHDALREIQRDLLQAVTGAGTDDTALAGVAQVVERVAGAISVFRFERDDAQKLAMATRLSLPGAASPQPSWRAPLLSLATAACREGRLQTGQLDEQGRLTAFAVPVFLRKRPPEAICIVVASTPASARLGPLLAPLMASHLTFWHLLQESTGVESEAQRTAAVLELLARLESADSPHHASLILASEVQAYLQCQRVAVALCGEQRTDCRLEAISGMAKFDRRSEVVRAMEDAINESVVRDSITIWPTGDASQRHATLAHQRLCSLTGCQCVVSSPLHDEEGRVVGAWLFFGDKDFAEQPLPLSFIRACQRPVGTCLRLVARCNASLAKRLSQRWERIAASTRLKVGVFVAGLLLIALMLPMRYRVNCDCQLQPVTRRFVAAPYDATLDNAVKAPGDVVSVGDVLARIDGREIRWELAGLMADRDSAEKQRDAAMAAHKVAEAQIAKLEMERLDLKIRLLQDRIEHLEIKSPLDGIVISGDLEKAEGVPLTIGQTLFEIAPLDRMIVEVAVPEDEIAYVKPALEVDVRLDAYPRQSWRAKILRIHPRTEIRDDESVFIAELMLANPDGLLRPGMNGRAKIAGPRRPIAWNLFHRPWEYFTQALGW